MSTGSDGRDAMASRIPEALRAVLTTAQQFLLMDTVMLFSVSDLRRALLDATYAEHLVQRPPSATGRTQFTPRPASESELSAAAQLSQPRESVAMQRAQVERLREQIQARADAERARRQRQQAQIDAVADRRRAAEAERELREEAEQLRREEAAANSRRRPPNQSRGNSRGMNFAAEIQNIARSSQHRPGHVPVLGGQVAAREESLTAARANRLHIDWSNPSMWRLFHAPQSTVPIATMTDQQLADEIEYAVTRVARIFQVYADGVWQRSPGEPVLAQARRWLAAQTSFRALVQEAIRRGVALYGSSTAYVLEFVLPASSNAQLADFVNHPVQVVTEESVVDTFGRSGRALRLDDD